MKNAAASAAKTLRDTLLWEKLGFEKKESRGGLSKSL